MIAFLKSLTLSNWVDIAGVAGFVLSLALALIQIFSNRLRVEADDFVLIETEYYKSSLFLFCHLINKTKIPFSLIDVYTQVGWKGKKIPVAKAVRTFNRSDTGPIAGVKPVVLSSRFPAKFDSYDVEPFLFEVSPRNISKQDLCPLHKLAHSQMGPLQKISRRIHMLCTHQPQPRLVLRTSRGRRVIPVHVTSIQGWQWLETYAVRKAGYEEKLIYPN